MSGTYANTACPYCAAALAPLPRAKKACPTCRQPIYVRSAPDGLTYLLQEQDLPVLEDAWVEHHETATGADAAGINAAAAEAGARMLRDYRESGVTQVEVSTAPDACSACRAASRGRHRLDAVPPLPIPGCTSEFCRCDYVPVV